MLAENTPESQPKTSFKAGYPLDKTLLRSHIPPLAVSARCGMEKDPHKFPQDFHQ